MADNKKMSVEEVLAACRSMDGAGASQTGGAKPASKSRVEAPASASDEAASSEATSGASAETASAETVPAETASAESAASGDPAGGGGGKKPGEMSTADILAGARAGGKPAAKPAAGVKPAAGAKPDAAKPAAGGMSTADILAAARGDKSGGAKSAGAKPAAAKPAADAAAKAAPKKDAAKPAAASGDKPAAAKAAAAGKTPAAMDTASILAAARGAAKPGPMSKKEAAARTADPVVAEKSKKKEVPPMPEKPAYAQPRAPVAGTEDERRGFLRGIFLAFSGSALAVGFSSLAVTFNLWTLGFARFMFPNIVTEPPTRFKVGFPDELAPGQVETKYVPQFGVWIVRHEYDGAPQIYALQTVCTHLGCTPNWLEGEQKFKCPCHGSGFYKDGVNFEGPAPRPLERFAIRLSDDGQLEVDKSRKFKEEMGQWRDPASFVPV